METTFNFPFQPYPIQEKFMRELYWTLENQKLGIFESPTGTGKSLSICCGALQWLRDSYKNKLQQLEDEINQLRLDTSDSGETDEWLQEEYEKIRKKQNLQLLQNKLDKMNKRKDLFNEMRTRVAKFKSNLYQKSKEPYLHKGKDQTNVTMEEYVNILEDKKNVEDGDLILEECEEKEDQSDDEVVEEEQDCDDTKIYISSRTHSQLSQFIGEIKKTIYREDTRVVTLASRQHYCINSDISKLKNVNLINERCLDMQKSKSMTTSVGEDGRALKKTKTKSCSGCLYYNQTNITQLKERMLVDILDMEDLMKCGKELKACPYYASRMAMDDAEVVLISHAGIVSSGARSGISLKLQDNVVILDEAHGLAAALESAHAAPVAIKQLVSVKACLKLYVTKYRARLSSRNLLLLNQMSFVVGKLLGMVKPDSPSESDQKPSIHSVEEFVIKADIDHMNLRPLIQFCRTSRLAPKLHGFSMRYSQEALEEELTKSTVTKKSSLENFLSSISKKKVESPEVEVKPVEAPTNQNQKPTETSAGSGLYAILDFLERLCDRSADGRVLVQTDQSGSGLLKYLLLEPAERFAEVVTKCRSVVVAGGTMEPVSEFESLLTNGSKDMSSVVTVRCGHVVSPDNVLAACVSRGPAGQPLNYCYQNRTQHSLSEVGRILRNICTLVPGGVVCFLPSYSFENSVYEQMKNDKVIEAISKKKTVFREPKSAADVDQVLSKYAAAVRKPEAGRSGALLLSVVGGKLSEGLNFSDELGRCVALVGMPYPHCQSVELQEKMRRLGPAAAAYYENLCMKAVNQCIGRAVRHANDYACVLLIDERYSRPHTIAALPSFVQNSLISNCNFGQTVGSIAKFFSKHKDKK